MSIIELNEIKSETEWYLRHYRDIKDIMLHNSGEIKVHGRCLMDPDKIVTAIDSAIDSLDEQCKRIAIKRYFENEYWKITVKDECIGHQTYYRRVDTIVKTAALQLVAERIIKIK